MGKPDPHMTQHSETKAKPIAKSIIVAALYHFARLSHTRELQPRLQACCQQQHIFGTLLLAEEGINGTIAGHREGIDTVLAMLRAEPGLAGLEHKESFTDTQPFHRMKVRLKKEIVTMGVPGTDPAKITGTYLDAEQFNAMIEDPNVLVVDTRNDYEVAIGSFKNAASPNTKTFREFPAYVENELSDKKNQKIAMFCTGGIRCEKSTSYLKSQGFDEVYHLKGGILKYLETVDPEHNLWQGECFVFDGRVSVDKNLKPGTYDQCHACRRPINEADKQSPHFQRGVSCPHCINEHSDAKRIRFAERQRQIDLAQARGERHIGQTIESSQASTPTDEK